jgi:hypothetical protein
MAEPSDAADRFAAGFARCFAAADRRRWKYHRKFVFNENRDIDSTAAFFSLIKKIGVYEAYIQKVCCQILS